MKRHLPFFFILFGVLGGILPIFVFRIEHGSLGAASIDGYQAMTRGQQIAQVAAGLYIKPAYMLLTLALIILLAGQTGIESISLRWGLIAFLVGETFCGVNFLIYRHESLISEYIHSYGMVLAFGLFAFGLMEGADRHILHVNQGRCALGGLCKSCGRNTPPRCAARRVAIMVLIMAGILALLPLPIRSAVETYGTSLLGYPYSYARFAFYQWYETRLLPIAALAFFLLALIPLLRRGGDPIPRLTKILFSAGVGALGFSLFRVALSSFFRENLVWFEFWEELTELMFISATGFVLWQFRAVLLKKSAVLGLMTAGESGK
jgi:hypothetical protein